jgi:photosynthetic reaction center cytochrome c subunit
MNVKTTIVGMVEIIACLLVGAGLTGGAKAQSAGQAQTPPSAAPKTAEQQFKNIQVLKGIPADQLIPTMQFISASLGVECEFCHVHDAFEKDDKKPKEKARKMIEMMYSINEDSFDGYREVTCYSCHRGNTKPLGTPPVMEETKSASGQKVEEHASDIAQAPIGGPSGDELFEKYLLAVGGSSAIEKITTRVMKGSITFGDRNIPIDIYSKEPEKRISFVHTPDGDNITAFDGHEGWLAAPKRPVREMHGPDIDGAAMDADLQFPAHLKEMCSKTELQGVEKINDEKTDFVLCERAGKTPVELYFDAQTDLLVRLVRYGETALGRLPTQIDYADYHAVDGVRVPYRWTLARPGGRFTIQLSEVEQNVPIDDSKFAKPAPPAEDSKSAK